MSDNEQDGGSNRRSRTLGPFTEARRVRDSVLIEERRGNRVTKIFIDEENWEVIGELFGRFRNTTTEDKPAVKPPSEGEP